MERKRGESDESESRKCASMRQIKVKRLLSGSLHAFFRPAQSRSGRESCEICSEMGMALYRCDP
jgi:hypothetical protein